MFLKSLKQAELYKRGVLKMKEHPIQNIMQSTLEKINAIVDANTIVGTPIAASEGITIIPVSKISMGFASGGSDIATKTPKELFGGGGGAGVNITPVAFLVVQNGNVRLLQITKTSDAVDRAVSLMPEIVDKITTLLKKTDSNEEDEIQQIINTTVKAEE